MRSIARSMGPGTSTACCPQIIIIPRCGLKTPTKNVHTSTIRPLLTLFQRQGKESHHGLLPHGVVFLRLPQWHGRKAHHSFTIWVLLKCGLTWFIIMEKYFLYDQIEQSKQYKSVFNTQDHQCHSVTIIFDFTNQPS